MVTWKSRFEDLIHETNGQELPSIVRRHGLEQAIKSQLMDSFRDLNNKMLTQGYTSDEILMSERLWQDIVSDPAFGNIEKDSSEDK